MFEMSREVFEVVAFFIRLIICLVLFPLLTACLGLWVYLIWGILLLIGRLVILIAASTACNHQLYVRET